MKSAFGVDHDVIFKGDKRRTRNALVGAGVGYLAGAGTFGAVTSYADNKFWRYKGLKAVKHTGATMGRALGGGWTSVPVLVPTAAGAAIGYHLGHRKG